MREKVLAILSDVNSEVEKNQNADLLATGIIDSFDIVNIVVELEEEFDIEIDADLVIPENFKTVDAITSLIQQLV